VRLRRSTTTSEVDPLSLILINFNTPVRTPGLHWVETALEFSSNKIFLAICRIRQVSSAKWARLTPCVWASYIYMLKSVGERTETCGTPACITLGVGISPSTETLNFLWERKEPMSLIRLVENFNLDSLYSKLGCHVVSKAFSMSKNTAAVHSLLLKLRVTWSVSLIYCNVLLWRARKPNWLALSRPLYSVCFWRIFRITFSNSLPVVDRRLIGHKSWGNFGSLRGFGKVIIFASKDLGNVTAEGSD
jgi:hypothetical protein